MNAEPIFITIAGGRIRCLQCSAHSKRTKQRCGAAAMRGKAVCRAHGGLSRGPVTAEGRRRCALAKTIHGHETRQARRERSVELSRLAVLESMSRLLGLIDGQRTRGPKPKG